MSWKFIVVFKLWIDIVPLIPGTFTTESTLRVFLLAIVFLSMIANKMNIFKPMKQGRILVSRIVRLIKNLC